MVPCRQRLLGRFRDVCCHRFDIEPAARTSLRPIPDATGADPESRVPPPTESGVSLGRHWAAPMAVRGKCPDSLLAAYGHFSMAADTPSADNLRSNAQSSRVITL
jgi:hypothetical protein